MDYLENENENKAEKIKLLESKINFYENNNCGANYNNKRKVNSNLIYRNNAPLSNNYNINSKTVNNDLRQSIISRQINYSVYSDNFEITNKHKKKTTLS